MLCHIKRELVLKLLKYALVKKISLLGNLFSIQTQTNHLSRVPYEEVSLIGTGYVYCVYVCEG